MFLHLSVSHSVHRWLYPSIEWTGDGVYPRMQWGCTPPTLTLGRHPSGQIFLWVDAPWADTLGRHPPKSRHPWVDIPLGRHPLGRHPLGRHP